MPPYFWQEPVWDNFVAQVGNSHLPHAILISGGDGLGADKLAKAMGQYILCLSPLESVACGICRSCRLLAANSHPDLSEIIPEEGATQIKIDQVRRVSDSIGKTAQQGGYKVITISPAEKMNLNAANALLKNLEEPAGKSLLILVTYNMSRLLPTIRSRCAKANLVAPEKNAALDWLKQNNIDDAEALLEEASGLPLKVMEWRFSDYPAERMRLLKMLVDVAGGAISPMLAAKQAMSLDPRMLVHCVQMWVDLMLKKQVVASFTAAQEFNELFKVIEHVKPARIYRYRDRVCIKRAQLESTANPNPALFVEELMLDWHALVKGARP